MKLLERFRKVKEIVEVKTNSLTIDEQIYVDVYSAQQLLLDKAKEVLDEPFNYDKERVDRLEKLDKLGFGNAEEVKEFKIIKQKRENQKKIQSKIKYYNHTYPLNKFIDEKSVKKVCEKYGLLLTFVKDYIAEIPEKNQNEIINFKVKGSDTRHPDEMYKGVFLMNLGRTRHFFDFNSNEEYKSWREEMMTGENLLIIAPERKLDTHGKIKEGHVLKIEIKDPVVLQPVEHGYLILSSWGLEASDDLIANPINN